MTQKSFWLFFLICILAVAGGYFYYQHNLQTPSLTPTRQNTVTPVTVVQTQYKTIHDEIEALGTAFANEAVNVTATVTDIVKDIRFDDGQHVKKNQILVILESSEELAQKNAELAQLEEHKRELKRLGDLLKKNATSKTEYDARETLLAISKQRLAEIEARIEDRTIRAPFDGVLGLRKISIGSLVEPGSLITTIDDISQIKLDFFVPDVYLDVVKEGIQIKALAESQNIFEGQVTNINSRVDATTRSVEVRAILPNPDELIKPGMLLKVKLLRNKRQAIIIPEEAVVQLQKEHYVFTVDEEKNAQRQKIVVGKRHPGWVEVVQGLEENTVVIIRGITKIRPGSQVEPKLIPFKAES